MSSASSDRRRDSSGEDDAKTAYTVGTSVQGSELTEGPTAPSNNTPVYALSSTDGQSTPTVTASSPTSSPTASTIRPGSVAASTTASTIRPGSVAASDTPSTVRRLSLVSSGTASSIDLRASDLLARLAYLGPRSDHSSSGSSVSSGRVHAGREQADMTGMDREGRAVGTYTYAPERPPRTRVLTPLRDTPWAGERTPQSVTRPHPPTFVPPPPTGPAESTSPATAAAAVTATMATSSTAPPPASAAPVTVMVPTPPVLAIETAVAPGTTGSPPPATPGSVHSQDDQDQDITRTSHRTDESWRSSRPGSVVAQSFVLGPRSQDGETVDGHVADVGAGGLDSGADGPQGGNANNQEGRVPSPGSDTSQRSGSRRRREHVAGGSRRRNSGPAGNSGARSSFDPELLQRQFRDHMEDTAATNNKILSKLTSIEGDTHKLVDDSKGIRKSTKDASVHLHNLNVQSILTRNSINFGASTLTRAVEANTDSQRESRELLQQMLRQNEENNLAMWRMNEEMWGRVLQRLGEPSVPRSAATPRPPSSPYGPAQAPASAGVQSPVTPVVQIVAPTTSAADEHESDWQEESSSDTLHMSQDDDGQSDDPSSSSSDENVSGHAAGSQAKGKDRE